MKPTAGRIVKYPIADGKFQYAIMRHLDQTKEATAAKKACLRLMDEKLKMIQENGKDKTALIDISKLQLIGMVD